MPPPLDSALSSGGTVGDLLNATWACDFDRLNLNVYGSQLSDGSEPYFPLKGTYACPFTALERSRT